MGDSSLRIGGSEMVEDSLIGDLSRETDIFGCDQAWPRNSSTPAANGMAFRRYA